MLDAYDKRAMTKCVDLFRHKQFQRYKNNPHSFIDGFVNVACVLHPVDYMANPYMIVAENRPAKTTWQMDVLTEKQFEQTVLSPMHVCHAEQVLIEKALVKFQRCKDGNEKVTKVPSKIFVTKAPCIDCANNIVSIKKAYANQCGFFDIQRIVTAKPYRINPFTGNFSKWYQSQMQAMEVFEKAGISVLFADVKYEYNKTLKQYIPLSVE